MRWKPVSVCVCCVSVRERLLYHLIISVTFRQSLLPCYKAVGLCKRNTRKNKCICLFVWSDYINCKAISIFHVVYLTGKQKFLVSLEAGTFAASYSHLSFLIILLKAHNTWQEITKFAIYFSNMHKNKMQIESIIHNIR